MRTGILNLLSPKMKDSIPGTAPTSIAVNQFVLSNRYKIKYKGIPYISIVNHCPYNHCYQGIGGKILHYAVLPNLK